MASYTTEQTRSARRWIWNLEAGATFTVLDIKVMFPGCRGNKTAAALVKCGAVERMARGWYKRTGAGQD